MWPRNLRDFEWSTRITITISAIPRTMIQTMYFWIPPSPRGARAAGRGDDLPALVRVVRGRDGQRDPLHRAAEDAGRRDDPELHARLPVRGDPHEGPVHGEDGGRVRHEDR